MAEQYFNAATILIEGIETDRIEDYKLGIPILYLYGLWLELAVKGICMTGRENGHNLARLSETLTNYLKKTQVEVPDWVIARLLEMDRIDPRSTSFRYAENKIPGEVYVSLPHLRAVMRLLRMALASVVRSGTFPPDSFFASRERDASGEDVDDLDEDED